MADAWSEEYFLGEVQRKIKNEIAMKFFIEGKPRPTKTEYESIFADWVSKLKCEISNYDLCVNEE